jgi:hypothetical protein
VNRQEPLSVFYKPETAEVAAPAVPVIRRLTFSRTLAAISAAALIAFILTDLGTSPAKSSVVQEPPVKSAWIETPRANGAYEISSPALQAIEQNYITRRHRNGGGRKDLITFGAANNAGAAYIRVVLYRPGTEGAIPMDPVEAVASVAAESAINAELTGPNGIVITKFGDLATIEMKLTTDQGPRTCLATAAKFDDPSLGLVAWYCNPGVEIVAVGQVACLLDRLSLVSSGRDEKLIEFFAKAELNRSFCDAKNTLLGNAPRPPMPEWLDTKTGPRLRGKFSLR